MVMYTLELCFARWDCDRLTEDSVFGKKIIFSDEAHFDLGGYVNKQNCRIWGTDNRHAYIEKLTHPKRVTLGGCWTKFWSQKLKSRILATFGFNRTALRATQRPVFHDLIISRRANVVWPPRSCDLTSLDYYLWGAVKDKCYADKSETINALKNNICEAIDEISRMCLKIGLIV